MSEESVLFDTVDGEAKPHTDGVPIEALLDRFADLAKESTQLATKLRTSISTLADSARLGAVSTAQSRITGASGSLADLKILLDRLAADEATLGLRGERPRISDLTDEISSELAKRGVNVAEGPRPYLLAYPAWFKIQRGTKGVVEIVVNGDRLDTVRPSAVADRIAEIVNEKFEPTKFADLLISVRELLRRAGVAGKTVALENVYDVLTIEPGRRVARKDFSRGSFYYSVHRLAERFDALPQAPMDFPPANRPDNIFFSRSGVDRKYLTVEFSEGGTR